MKAMKKDLAGVSPVIAVILMVAITVVLAGVVFLWAQSFTDDSGGSVKTMNIRVSLYEGAAIGDGTLDIEVLGGTIVWTDYTVKVESATMTTTATTSSAGDTASFTSAAIPIIVKGSSYKVQIVDLANNKVVYTNENVIAKGA